MAGDRQSRRTVKSFEELVNDCLDQVEELFPWDLEEVLQNDPDILILDIREPYEFDDMHIRNSVNVPRGVLE
jgi:predicted sulfurtransferase